MKKSTLALSVAAALSGLGFIGSASAVTVVQGATADTLSVNPDGIGHQLLFPYFTAQAANATLINIVNTDTANGKVVKVRFRGASNSDDLYDITLLLSPGDVWTAAVTQNATTGLAQLFSPDTSCILPAGSANNTAFLTLRTDPQATVPANQTREGYIEVINMADVPLNTGAAAGVDSLFEAIKHVAGVAPCTVTVLDAALGLDVAPFAAAPTNIAINAALGVAANLRGMALPTGGLTGDWIILNQTNTSAWSGSATALRATAAGPFGPVTAAGNLVFWPQRIGTPTNVLTSVTADPLLVNAVIAAQLFDLPDLSTPYVTADGVLAATRADAATAALALTSLKHHFVTDAPTFMTDVVFSQPTRRYSVAVNYAALAAADNTITTTGTLASAVYRGLGLGVAPYNQVNTSLYSRQVCLDTVNAPGVQSVFDREETSPTVGSGIFVISPNVISAPNVQLLCGETSVVSINQGGISLPSRALSATVARSDVTFVNPAIVTGWASWALPGVPVLGSTFIRGVNGAVNYGFSWTHKVTR